MSGNTEILLLKAPVLNGKPNDWLDSFADLLKHSLQSLVHYQPAVEFVDDIETLSSKLSTCKLVLVMIPEQPSESFVPLIKSLIEHKRPELPVLKILTAPASGYLSDIQQYTGFNFFDIDPYLNLLRKFDNGQNAEISRLYWSKMVDLAFSIQPFLSEQHKQSSKQDSKCVYLAQTTSDQFDNQDLIRRELLQRGFRVLPEQDLPTDFTKLKDEIGRNINQSILSIHIIGNHYGDKITGSDLSLIDYQQVVSAEKCAEIFSRSNFDRDCFRLVWISPDVKPADENQKIFIEKLKKNDKIVLSELVQAPINDFKSLIINKLEASAAPVIESNAKDSSKKVYLIHENPNSTEVKQLSNWLAARNIHAITPELSSSDSLSQHRENLITVSAVIVFDTASHEHWILSKVKDLLKAPGYGRIQPFDFKMIVSPRKQRLQSLVYNNDFVLIDPKDEYISELESLVTKMNNQ